MGFPPSAVMVGALGSPGSRDMDAAYYETQLRLATHPTDRIHLAYLLAEDGEMDEMQVRVRVRVRVRLTLTSS